MLLILSGGNSAKKMKQPHRIGIINIVIISKNVVERTLWNCGNSFNLQMFNLGYIYSHLSKLKQRTQQVVTTDCDLSKLIFKRRQQDNDIISKLYN